MRDSVERVQNVSEITAREVLGIAYKSLWQSDEMYALLNSDGELVWVNEKYKAECLHFGINLMQAEFLDFEGGITALIQNGNPWEEEKKLSVGYGVVQGERIFGELMLSQDRESGFFLLQFWLGNEYEALPSTVKQQHLSYSRILDIISADIAIFDTSHKYLYINKSSLPNDEVRAFLMGRDDFDYCKFRNKPIDLALKRRVVFEEVIREKSIRTFEEEFETAQGPRHHLRNFFPVFDQVGEVEFVIGYGIDITSLKRVEHKNLVLFNALQSAKDGVAITDPDGVYTYLNPAHVAMFGYEHESELKGHSWIKLYPVEESERLIREVFPILMEKGSWSGEMQGLSKKGEKIYQQISLNLLPNKGIVCISRDIGQEYARNEEIKKLALVAEKSNSMVMITDSKGLIDWVNDSFVKTTGFKFQDIYKKGPSDFFWFDSKELTVYSARILTEYIPKSFNGEFKTKTKQGKARYLQIDATPIYDSKEQLLNVVVVLHDITSIKEVELTLTNLLKEEKVIGEMKSQFISLTSHEFRTPLTGIQVSRDILELTIKREAAKLYPLLSKHFNRISSQILRLGEILDKILLMGKLESQKVNFKPELGSLLSLVQRLIKVEMPVEGQQFAMVQLIVQGEEQEVVFDVQLMEHVFMNLIQNALKYSGGGRRPQVFLRFEKEYVEVEVKDFGIGIPEEDKKYLFTAFFRSSNAENIQGTGLGLVLVKQFVEMHKGEIRLESEVNKGSSFFVKLNYHIELEKN